jgi:hypothetical protein
MATLQSRLSDLATRVGAECKALRSMINGNAADLTGLTTTNKTSLVAAVNELKTGLDSVGGGGGGGISADDAIAYSLIFG